MSYDGHRESIVWTFVLLFALPTGALPQSRYRSEEGRKFAYRVRYDAGYRGTASAREVPIIGFTVDTTIAPENTTRPTDNIGRASDTEAIIKGDTGEAIGRDVQAVL